MAIPLLINCGQDKGNAANKPDGAADVLFTEFLKAIPNQPLPINLSCGLPDGTLFASDFEKFKSYMPKSVDRVFGRIDSRSDNFNLIMYGETGDDIYPVLFSFDNRGQVIDSSFLILHGCGGADDQAIPHSFVLIDKDLTIELTDTTRLIHYPEGVTGTDGYVIDSIRVSRVELRVDGDGRFVRL